MTGNGTARGHVIPTFAPRTMAAASSAETVQVDGDALPEGATPAEKAEIVRRLIAGHPQGRLALSAPGGGRVDLRGVALPEANLHLANLPDADLRDADLHGASLGKANLRGALLEGANLQGADLAGALLQGAKLEGANLRGALLEEADLREAGLRFTDLREAVLEGADLGHADLWSTALDGTTLAGAALRGATLREASACGADVGGADLREATLQKVDLRGAQLRGVDLRGATLSGCDLTEAQLGEARLQGVDLSGCTLTHAHLGGVWFDKTQLRRNQLGGAIGEEMAGDYEGAATGYLALERNFLDLGDADAAAWAYGKRRRMQKLAARGRGRVAARNRAWAAAARGYLGYAAAQLVEWVCDYGESIPRVLYSLLAVYLVFILLYGLTGSVVHVALPGGAGAPYVTRDPRDLAIYSLYAITTSGTPAVGLLPRAEWVQLLTGTEAFMGIFLTGLLGFVTGNKIRR
jgi:uncharacterized protein YjbI with pentapeptide repeats